jgi:hypothetical protein
MTSVWFCGLCLCFAFSYPNLKANMTAMGEVQKLAQDNSTKQMRLMATQQSIESQAEIADSRYKSGCIMVVASNSPDSLTALEDGRPVMDATRNRPLSAGAVVCDGFGNTGVIVKVGNKPVVGEMAFTGNQELVDAAKRRANKRFSLPRS